MFRRLAALIGPLIAVLSLCPTAAAGPMSWSYRAIVQAGHGGTVPPAAAVLNLSRFPVGDTPGSAAYYTAPLPTGSVGNVEGSGTIVLAAASKGNYDSASTMPDAAVDGFRTLLEITDVASGARGFTYVNGTGGLVGGSGGSGEVQLNGEGRVLMTLGKNRYDISWRQAESESVSRIVADVNVTSLVNTPEPATLALAGLGLGAVGVRRLRRS